MGQLRALVGLRWRMVRSKRARRGLIALLALVPLTAAGVSFVGQVLPSSTSLFHILLLAPTLFLVFAVLTVVAPLVAGGGNELFPEGQLAAFPVKPGTVYACSVITAPLNLAWMTQFVVLFGTTAAVAARGPRVVLALVTTFCFIVFCTVTGQALAWLVIGLRQRRRGRQTSRLLGSLTAVAVAVIAATGSARPVLDQSPTTAVVRAALDGASGQYRSWALDTAILLGLAWLAVRAGGLACGWALRRTAPLGRAEMAPVERRRPRGSGNAELLAIDRASVLRSTPLRRGCVVLAVLPGAVALLAHPTWFSLTLLPGLVSAGAGLLFGINVFCLDGAGAVWVATLPHDPMVTLRAKLITTGGTCLAAVAIAVAIAGIKIDTVPSLAELVALVGSMLGGCALVVATCAKVSVSRPHKADLRGPRDTPAPPASMAVYSARLALSTTFCGLAFGTASVSESLSASVATSLVVLLVFVLSLRRTFRKWSDETVRARVVTTVSYG